MDLKSSFDQAVKDSKELAERPDNEALLEIYSLYKQATEGDAPTDVTFGMFDIINKAKHDAWEKLKGTTKEDAMQRYVDLIMRLKTQ